MNRYSGDARPGFPKAWAVLTGLVLVLSGTACEEGYRMAVGRAGDLGLVTDWGPEDSRVRALTEALEAPVEMIRPEQRFEVLDVSPENFKGARDWKCLAFLVNMNEPGPLHRQLDRLLTDEEQERMRGRPVAFRVVRDVWALGQAVLVVHAENPAAFVAYMRDAGEEMVMALERGLEQALVRAVLALGEDAEMTRYLEQHHGFHITVPKEWLTAEDQEGRVVRLYRVIEPEPPRFMLIHYGPASEMPATVEEMLALRDRLGLEYYDGDRILHERSGGEPGFFQGEPAMVLRGVWQNEKYTMGGPFQTFVFRRGDRFYMIDCSVFNPPGDKLPILREVLALARTFRHLEAT